MANTVVCDRCKRTVSGSRSEQFTAGFYDTSAGYWANFATREEKTICDCCMWASAFYRAQYQYVHTCGVSGCVICTRPNRRTMTTPLLTDSITAFDDYQTQATALASYPDVGSNIIYPALGLAGESGEVVDKIKKLWRNKGITSGKQLSYEDKEALSKEMGDALWYIAGLAKEIGVSLSAIATLNIIKLTDRHKRGVIKSEGDNR